jgi:putative tryptophan/tyrosine transport system substrate-binding protein
MSLFACGRNLLSLMVGVLLLCARSEQGHAAGPMVEVGSWFKVGADLMQDLQIAVSDTDSQVFTVKPKRLLSSRPLRRVLVLYPRASSAYDTAFTTFAGLFSDKRVDAEFTVNHFKIDSSRGKAALEHAEANNFDLVVAMGSETTAWLWEHYRGGRLPVVSVCSKDPVLLGQMKNYEHGSGSNFAFTSLNMPIDAQMSYVMQLRPDLKNLAILVDANNVSAVQTQSKPAGEFARARGIRVYDLAIKSTANVKEELGRSVRDAVAMMRKNDPDLSRSLFWITGSTTIFTEMATINANAFRVPVLSAVTDVVQAGDVTAVLSVGVSFESNAYQAALFAVGIVEGQRVVGEFPVGIVSPPDISISFRKAREIGLRIPFGLFEGATVVYDNDGQLVRSTAGAVKSSATIVKDGAAPVVAVPTLENAFAIE